MVIDMNGKKIENVGIYRNALMLICKGRECGPECPIESECEKALGVKDPGIADEEEIIELFESLKDISVKVYEL